MDLHDTDDDFGARTVSLQCAACKGERVRFYPSTATYMHSPDGFAGAAMTLDLCDQCWGSGNTIKAFRDVRALIKELATPPLPDKGEI